MILTLFMVLRHSPVLSEPWQSACGALSNRCAIDALDGGVEGGVELLVRLLRFQALGERAREARRHSVLAREALVRFVARIAARQRDDAQHVLVLDEISVEVVLVRD